MLENRLILTATLGYILGIILGLYCKYSIALYIFIAYLISLILKNEDKKRKFKLLSFRRYFRYIKLIFTKKVIKIIVIFSIISNSIVLFQNQKFNNLFKDMENQDITIEATIISNIIKNEKFIIKINNVNGKSEYKNTKLYLYVNKNVSKDIKYGSKVLVYGKFNYASKRSNYKGFDYRKYLKTLNIYGIVKSKNIKVVSQDKLNILFLATNKLHLKITDNIEQVFQGEAKSLLEGIMLGDKDEIDKNIISNFSKSNITHILAVSGLHISYIVILSSFIFNKSIGKHYAKIITSIILILYMFITNFSPSVVRAGISGILVLLANYFYRKNDMWQSLAISLFIFLIYNPFLIQSLSLQLSFAGTIGIIYIQPIISKWWKLYKKRLKQKSIRKNIKLLKIFIKLSNYKVLKILEDSIIVTISATLGVLPIVLLNFNKVNITNLIIGLIASFLVGPIVSLGFIFSIFSLIPDFFLLEKISEMLSILLSMLLNLLIEISQLGEKLAFGQANLVTPSIIQILVYYLFIFCFFIILNINITKVLSNSQKRTKNLISLFKYKFYQNKRKVISLILFICILFSIYKIIPKNLKIYFIDVGQGDSCLIVTPLNKKILIDGGGSTDKDFDIGEKILMPYLLDRKISTIDYVFISHFDTDHVGGLLYILENMKVKNVIISKQPENSENFKVFLKIIKKKNLKLIVVDRGDKLNIEKNIYFEVLSPESNNFIQENTLNNNSIVCKFYYKTFSVLFTGDIEEIAEKQILQQYKNNLQILNSTVLKVAHHGSKSSSTDDFIKAVDPKFALIGVGKNNKFGHPNEVVIKKLEGMRVKNI